MDYPYLEAAAMRESAADMHRQIVEELERRRRLDSLQLRVAALEGMLAETQTHLIAVHAGIDRLCAMLDELQKPLWRRLVDRFMRSVVTRRGAQPSWAVTARPSVPG